MNRQIRLKSRPAGMPAADNFETVDAPMPALKDGEVLRRTIYLSLDPYMRGRMSEGPSYAAPVNLHDVMCGHTVSEVVESGNPDFRAGDVVTGYDGWQQYAASNGKDLRKLDPKVVPVSTAIGVLGMPGATAYVGLFDIGQPKPGETVVVSAASGAVGSIVGTARENPRLPCGRHRRVARQVPVRRRRAGLRRLHQLQDRRPRAGAARRVPQRRRHLLRERRRQGVRGGAARDQSRSAHPAVRHDLGVQRDRRSRRPEPAGAPRPARDDQGLHRQRSLTIASRRF